ncbi:hypothetical protein GCM10023259_038780 [Thermocatellispora tengchongensis]
MALLSSFSLLLSRLRRLLRLVLAGFLVVAAWEGQAEAVTWGRCCCHCSQLQSHYAADAFLGPRHLIGLVTCQYQSLGELAGQAEGPLRRELLRLSAGYADFAGRLC